MGVFSTTAWFTLCDHLKQISEISEGMLHSSRIYSKLTRYCSDYWVSIWGVISKNKIFWIENIHNLPSVWSNSILFPHFNSPVKKKRERDLLGAILTFRIFFSPNFSCYPEVVHLKIKLECLSATSLLSQRYFLLLVLWLAIDNYDACHFPCPADSYLKWATWDRTS